MACPDFDLFKKRNDPEYLNWLAVGDGLRIICDGLREYAKNEMQVLHCLMLTKLSGSICACTCKLGSRKKCTHVSACTWARELEKSHCIVKKSRIPWHQSDSAKWHDPNDGYWEIAKLFMSDLGCDWSKTIDPKSTDPTGLLNLLYFCTHFKVQQSVVKSVRDRRNKWAHAPSQLVTDMDKQLAFQEIFNLLDDVELMKCKDIQECRPAIEKASHTSVLILQESELCIWKECKDFNTFELSRKVKEERKERKEIEKSLKYLREMIRTNEEMIRTPSQELSAKKDDDDVNSQNILFIMISSIVAWLICSIRSVSKHFQWFLFFITFLGCIQIGDKSFLSSDGGCYRATVKSPINQYGFQEFNFSSYLNYKKSNFFGRKWLFQELENIFENSTGPLGVLITGDPGSGKSAIMAQLICSPFSSLLIHNSIIGYHICDYSERRKRNGARFVRNLVDQIAGSLPEYSDHISNDKQVRDELEKRCESDPIGCFHDTIVGPLRELKTQPDGLRYIFIDALDECFEKNGESSEILDILGDKLVYFPNWLKVVITSRNWTAVTRKLPRTVDRISLDPTDERNIEDIRFYISHFLSQNTFFVDRLLEAMGLKSTVDGVNTLINEMSIKGEGNFLFIKTTLEYLNKSQGRINIDSFPTRLYDTYDIFVKRQFGKDDFSRFKVLFEVLLAASSPLRPNEIASILNINNPMYTISVYYELLREVSSFLRYGQNGTISIFHQSFAEWLENPTDDSGLISVNKSSGHQYIADYIFDVLDKKNTTPVFEELTELVVHVSSGGILERHLTKLKGMNISKIQDACRCNSGILHALAARNGTASILDTFLQMFESVDVPDGRGLTPSFYAALNGNVDNMKILIKNGINLDYHIQFKDNSQTIRLIIEHALHQYSGCGIVHAAALNGHTKMVKLLIRNGASFLKPNSIGLTPFHVAAFNGHLGIAKLLHRFGATADIIALHHATARNHTEIVHFLLKAGVKDVCLSCRQGNISDVSQSQTIQDTHAFFCETALHAAVSRRYIDLVRLLLSFDKTSLECKHFSGKTPLIDAIERNDTEMVDVLLNEGANVEAECSPEYETAKSLHINMCQLSSLYKEGLFYTIYCKTGICSCGNRAIHVCGQYGLWKMAKKLIFEWHARILPRNCDGMIAAHNAVFNDHADFINKFNRTLVILDRRLLVNEAFLESAVLNGSTNTLVQLLKKTNATFMDQNGMTLIHQAASWSPYKRSMEKTDCSSAVFARTLNLEKEKALRIEAKRRLSTLEILVESQKDMAWFVNSMDSNGRSALHYAASAGFAVAVKYLVNIGGDWKAQDGTGNTPLGLALQASPQTPDVVKRYRLKNEKVFKTCNTTTYDETVAYLISLHKSSIKKCDLQSVEILNIVISKQMPLSFYQLLKNGVDINCRIEKTPRPFLRHLQQLDPRGEQVGEIFRMFKINVNMECGIFWTNSELHLMSYFNNAGNLFKQSIDEQLLPLQRLVSANSTTLDVLDKCYDTEGYLAIHRAARGGNVDALDWFVASGIDVLERTKSGLTSLDISLFCLGKLFDSPLLVHASLNMHKHIDIDITVRTYFVEHSQRVRVFEKLLVLSCKTTKSTGSLSWCSPNLRMLSPLHFAASRGMGIFEFVYKRAKRIVPGLPRNCTNKHKVVPLYLAQLFHPVMQLFSSSNLNEEIPQSQLLDTDIPTFQYPDREAEYHIIHNHCFGSPEVELFDSDIRDAVHCPGFYDLLPKRATLLEKTKQCSSACWVFTSHVSNLSTKASPSKLVHHWQEQNGNDEWRPKINLMLMLLYISEKSSFSSRLKKKITEALRCSRECRCTYVMVALQRRLTTRLKQGRVVNAFMAKRMGWKDTSLDGDMRDRWPFYFLYNKALKKYKSYSYLRALNSGLEIDVSYFSNFPDDVRDENKSMDDVGDDDHDYDEESDGDNVNK